MRRSALRAFLPFCACVSWGQSVDGLEFKPPAKTGEPFKGKAKAPAGTEWVVIFYRAEGEEDFNSFNLDLQPDGTFSGEQDIPVAPGAKLQYYAALRTPGGIKYLPKDAPGTFATLQMPGGAAPPPAAPGAAPAGSAPGQPPGTPPRPGLPGTPPAPGTPGFPGAPGSTRPGAYPGAPGTYPGAPGATGQPGTQGPGQKPGQMPGQLPGQVPGQPPPLPPPAHPLSLDLAVEQLVHHMQQVPDEQKTQAAGQVRLYHLENWGDGSFLLNARVVYSNQPFPGQPRWGLGEFQAILTEGRQRVQVGDTMAQESEFTLGGAGRRGFEYAYGGPGATGNAHLFALNTQTLYNTRGVAWPVKESAVYGGSIGYGWFNEAFKLKLVFLSGKDDPTVASNAAYAFPMPVREGSTGALVMDSRSMDGRLNLSGEYARSLFTSDLQAMPEKTSDQAWRFSTLWNDGPFAAHLGYHDVGREFGSVGVAYFVGDRRVLDGSLAWNRPSWSLSAIFADERTNPTGQVGLNQAWNQTAGVDARVGLAANTYWRVGVRQSRQEAEVIADPTIPFTNSKRSGFVTGLDIILPPLSSLSFNAQYDRITATGGFENTGSCTTLSFGGSLALGQRGRLSPNLSWSRTLSEPGAQRTTVANAFLSAEVMLVMNTLVFTLNGGESRTTLPTGDTLTTVSGEGTLRLLFDRWFDGKARASFGVKGSYLHVPAFGGGPANDNRVSLVLNVSL